MYEATGFRDHSAEIPRTSSSRTRASEWLPRARTFGVVSLLLLLLSACATTSNPARRVAHRTVFGTANVPIASTPEDDARMQRNCFKGCPILDPDFDFGPTVVVARDGYVLEHSSTDKIPIWVAEFVDKAQLAGSLSRTNPFKPDPKLKVGSRAELADYRGSGYDRGHQAPAGNQTVSRHLKDETFFLSNMAPQKGQLNQQIWAALEDRTREWVNEHGSAFELTGGFFYDPEEDDPATADGTINYLTIGGGAVAVPTHFYKIVVVTQPTLKAIAFVAENRGYPKPFDFAALIKSIDWIEEHAGINFMPELTAAEEAALERNPSPMF